MHNPNQDNQANHDYIDLTTQTEWEKNGTELLTQSISHSRIGYRMFLLWVK